MDLSTWYWVIASLLLFVSQQILFEIFKFTFRIKLFFYMAKESGQKFKYLKVKPWLQCKSTKSGYHIIRLQKVFLHRKYFNFLPFNFILIFLLEKILFSLFYLFSFPFTQYFYIYYGGRKMQNFLEYKNIN